MRLAMVLNKHPYDSSIISACLLFSFMSLHSFPSHSPSPSLSLFSSPLQPDNQTHSLTISTLPCVSQWCLPSKDLNLSTLSIFHGSTSDSFCRFFICFFVTVFASVAIFLLFASSSTEVHAVWGGKKSGGGALADSIGGKGDGRTARAGRMCSLLQLLIQLAWISQQRQQRQQQHSHQTVWATQQQQLPISELRQREE